MKKELLIVSLLLFLFLNIIAEERFLARIDNPDKDLVLELNYQQFDIASYKPGEYLDLVLTQTSFDNLLNKGTAIHQIKTEAQIKADLKDSRDLYGYRNYSELVEELEILALSYPSLISLEDVSDSWGKVYTDQGNSNYQNYYHDIWVLKLSDNVAIEEDEPNIYYMGTHHAREPISLEVSMAVLWHLLDNYGTDPDITYWIDNSQIWFIPLVNPDGHKIVTDEADVWWRKNIRDNDEDGNLDFSTWQGYPDGVDLNRNYGYEWGGTGTSNDPLEITYCGPDPFSEIETAAIRDLMNSRHFVAGISYHSYSELVLFPYGYNENIYAPDHLALSDLATSMAVTIPSTYGGHYTPSNAWQLYPCSGTTDDYAYGVHGTFSYTIELATEFIPPASQVEGICEDNLEAAMILLGRIHRSTLTGHITDAVTNEPLAAEIFIEGVDDTGEFRHPYTSDQEFGRYYRILLDGSYDVSISAYGYQTQTFENIQIDNTGQTILNVALQQAPMCNLNGTITDLDDGSPIAGACVEILNTPILPVYSDISGHYAIEEFPAGSYQIRISANNYIGTIQDIYLIEGENLFDIDLEYCSAYSFENGEFENFWTFSGNANWTIDSSQSYHGIYSARSGSIGGSQTSSLIVEIDVIEAGQISFYKKVSCEDDSQNNYDYLAFLIDGVEQERWDGEVSWSPESYPVSVGIHTFEWRYVKDGYVNSGADCGWIDYIQFPPTLADDFMVVPGTIFHELGTNLISEASVDLINNGNTAIDFQLETQPQVTWLSDFDPQSGTILPAELQTVNYTLNTTDLTEGQYECNLLITLDAASGRISREIPVILVVTSTDGDPDNLPLITHLGTNHPNPFNPETKIDFSLKNTEKVILNIYNIKGQLVRNLINQDLDAGFHQIIWDGRDDLSNPLPSGIYLYRLNAGNYQHVRKMTLLK